MHGKSVAEANELHRKSVAEANEVHGRLMKYTEG